ncbi:MAG: hypothetical protein MZV64_55285 [Ignavibacteriales bacterium]|nr:hypothetical protein [Ignavibacteriales bacterium]
MLLGEAVVWHVDRSDGERVLANQTNQNDDNESPIADGIQFRIKGAPFDFVNFMEVSNANGPHDPSYAAFAFNGSGFPIGDFPEGTDRPDSKCWRRYAGESRPDIMESFTL